MSWNSAQQPELWLLQISGISGCSLAGIYPLTLKPCMSVAPGSLAPLAFLWVVKINK